MCGVRKGPNGEGRCRKFVSKLSGVAEASLKQKQGLVLPSQKGYLSCGEHAHVEDEYLREHGTASRESVLIALPAANDRGRSASKASKKRGHPDISDFSRRLRICKTIAINCYSARKDERTVHICIRTTKGNSVLTYNVASRHRVFHRVPTAFTVVRNIWVSAFLERFRS